MVEASLIYGAVQTVGILIGVLIAVIEIRNIGKTRQTELLFQRFQSIDAPYMKAFGDVNYNQDWEDYEEWRNNYAAHINPEEYAKFMFIGTVYRSIGLLLKQRVADPDMLFEIYNPIAVLMTWKRYEPYVKAMRKIYNYPEY